MIIRMSTDDMVKEFDELNFMELTYLIKFLDEFIEELKYQRAYEEESLTDKQFEKMSVKIKQAEDLKNKLEKMWKSRITIE